MEKSVQAALIGLVKRVELYHGFRTLDAYQLVTQCVELKVCQAVFPHFACLAKIERRFLQGQKATDDSMAVALRPTRLSVRYTRNRRPSSIKARKLSRGT